MNRRHTSLFLSATLAAIAAITTIGCAEPVHEERQGSRTAKLLAPKAIFKAKASADTKKTLGIVEWRVFRGQRDVVLTGYGANGKAKKGVSIGFFSAEKGVKASLRARVLDGTMFAARHEYGGSTKNNGQMSSETEELLGRAFRDARAIRAHLLPSRGEVPLPGTGSLPPSNGTPGPLPQEPIPGIPGGADCGGNLMAIVMAAVQCIQQTGNSQMCLAAAQSAGSLGGACQQGPLDPGMPPYDPMGQGGPYDPCGGTGGYPGEDPMGGMGGYLGGMEGGMCGPIGGYPGEDPMGGGMGGYPGEMDDPFGDGGGMCPSCGMGGYPDDIYGDPMSGEPMGGMGGSEGGEGGFGEGW